MVLSTVLRPSVRAAFSGLIDYAGLFPPAKLTMAEAQREYDTAQSGPHAWMLGRFSIPAPSLMAQGGLRGPFSVIADPNVDSLAGVAAARRRGEPIEALEIPIGKSFSPLRTSISPDEVLDAVGALDADLVESGLRDLPVFLEIPRAGAWRGLLSDTIGSLARMRLGAKLRCGGITAEAFPSVNEVSEFIAEAVRHAIPFKATAGLHHPVRHVNAATGFMMHGFLNILAAAALAGRVEREALPSIVAEEDPTAFGFVDDAFTWRSQRVGVADLITTRGQRFIAYGSCSFAEPVDDLAAMRVIQAPR
ncbi:MAG: hypothetical protein JO104_11195 [Candidatus Eremiobacteraeota bacterium]|nr:hypothetical protein [Candidatus Eremiobacteraeota bacterium]